MGKQQIIRSQNMWPGSWYTATLIDYIGPYAIARNSSSWKNLVIGSAAAALVWSRITATAGVANIAQTHDTPWDVPFSGPKSMVEAGMIYVVEDTVEYIRPTVQKSALLYAVLAVQPILTILAIMVTWMLFSTPVGSGFGLASILSGIDHDSLNGLRGAGFSGTLRRDAKLVIGVSDRATISYEIVFDAASVRNGRLEKGVVYH